MQSDIKSQSTIVKTEDEQIFRTIIWVLDLLTTTCKIVPTKENVMVTKIVYSLFLFLYNDIQKVSLVRNYALK